MVNNLQKKSFSRINIDIIICLIIIFSIVTVYVNVATHDFTVFDDKIYVYENDYVISGLTMENIKWAFGFTAEKASYWHPLSWLSHMADCHFFGLDAGKHHLVNVIFHVLTSILLFVVLKMMTGARWKSSFVALLFALHPLNVDSVAWIAERKNLLSSFFWMLTTISYVYYSKKPYLIRYIITLFIFSMGLLAKPMLVTLPCVFMLLDYWPLTRIDNKHTLSPSHCPQVNLSRIIFEKIPFLVISFFAIGVSMFSLKTINVVVSSDAVPLTLRLTNAVVSYIRYLYKMILPINLAVYYPFPKSIPLWQVAGSIVLLLLITVIVIKCLKDKPYIALGWFWFLGTLVPVIGLIQGGLWPALADRFAYVPLIGIFISITWGLGEVSERLKYNKLFLIIPGALILITFSLISKKQLTYWEDDFSLFMHTKKVTTENAMTNYILGNILKDRGQIDQAILSYREALRITPNEPEFHVLIGVLLSKKGEKFKAFDHFSKAVLLKPDYFDAQCSLAASFFDKGNTESAIKHYLHALKLEPGSEEAMINLGNAYLASDQTDKAKLYYNKVFPLNIHAEKAYYHLAVVAEKMGDTTDAIKNYRLALNIEPEYLEAHNNLAIIFINKGQIHNGLYHFKEALRINPDYKNAQENLATISNSPVIKKVKSNISKLKTAIGKSPNNYTLIYKLGMMYFQSGEYRKAIIEFQKSLKIKPDFMMALDNMATLYVLTMEYNSAIAQFDKMLLLQPENNTIYYNKSCVYAKLGKKEKAIQFLKKAIEKGFNDWQYLKSDEDLENIRGTHFYKQLIKAG